MPGKFNAFTERTRYVFRLAEQEARRLNHRAIGAEHILLGLVHEGEGLAARVLTDLGVQLPRVRDAVEYLIGQSEQATGEALGLTPRAKRVVERAVAEANRLNHREVGTEHLLLGLLRDREGVAAGILSSFGISLQQARDRVAVLTSSNGHARERRTTPAAAVFAGGIGVGLALAAAIRALSRSNTT